MLDPMRFTMLHPVRTCAIDLSFDSGSVVAGLLMGAGLLIIGFVAYMRVRSTRAGIPGPSAPKPTRAPRGNQIEHMRAVMAEVQELTRASVAQMESRITKLESLIREADERLARMQGVSPQRAEHRPEMPHVEVRRTTPSRPSIGTDELSQRVFALADAGRSPGDIARELSEHTGKVELILALRQESRRAIRSGAD